MIPAGIYIHVPFCAVKCMYCDFYSIADRNTEIHRFVKAITNEIDRCNVDASDWTFDTIFIGGPQCVGRGCGWPDQQGPFRTICGQGPR